MIRIEVDDENFQFLEVEGFRVAAFGFLTSFLTFSSFLMTGLVLSSISVAMFTNGASSIFSSCWKLGLELNSLIFRIPM